MSEVAVEALPIILIGVLLFIYGLYDVRRRDKTWRCPPHHWVRKDNNALYCDKCEREVGHVNKGGWSGPQGGIFT